MIEHFEVKCSVKQEKIMIKFFWSLSVNTAVSLFLNCCSYLKKKIKNEIILIFNIMYHTLRL